MRILLLSLLAISTHHIHATQNDIEQITITATRNSSQLADLSTNLAAVNQQSINTVQAEHINQVLSRIPGAWISRGNGQEHLTAIRSPVLTGAGGCGAFFMAQDGISVRAPGFCNTNQLFDLNTEQAGRIEVVRGPASVLYGSNAVHGVINVLTPDITQLPNVGIALEGGENDYLRTKIAMTTSADAHSFAFLGNGTHDGGYKEQSGYDQQKLTFIHQYQGDKVKLKNVFAVSNLNQETAGFIRGFEGYKDPELKRQNPNPEAFRDNQSARAYSQISITGEQGSEFQITPYVRWSSMTFLQHFLPWQATETNSQRSVGVQAQYRQNYNNVVLLTGFDADFTQGELQETQEEEFSPTIPQGDHYDYQVDAQNLSPFVSINWQVSEQIAVDAGLRFEKTRYDYENQLSDGDACEPEVEGCRFTRPADQVNEFEEWSFHLGANYKLSNQQSLYVRYANGYRAPQATELYRLQAGQLTADLQPETIRSLELGWRAGFEKVFFEINGFDMQKDNFIFQDSQRQNISNGSTEHYGIEFLAKLSFADNWYASLNGTLARHRYLNDLTLSATPILNNEIDTAPEHMASAQIGWRDANTHYVELDWVHQGNYFLDPQNTASYDGHRLLNLRAGYQISNNLSAQLRVINLTDTDYAERADFAFGSYRYFVGEPRSVYFGINYQM